MHVTMNTKLHVAGAISHVSEELAASRRPQTTQRPRFSPLSARTRSIMVLKKFPPKPNRL
jgi:hypothetical protein